MLAGAATAALLASGQAGAATLRYGHQEDPFALERHQGSTFGGRVIVSALCDKLVDIDPRPEIVPQLATGWELSPDKLQLTFRLREGVRFHDGTAFDPASVKTNIERAKTLPESRRRGELAQVASVEVVDPTTVRFLLSQPFAPLPAQLSDRAGMMLSPKAIAELGANFTTRPTRAGPFRFVERKAQDSIRVPRFEGYWNAGAIHLDEIVYAYIDDPTVRLARLPSGQIEVAERVAATDLATVRNDPTLQRLSIGAVATSHLTVNVGAGERAKTPLGQNAKVRRAFELAIDRVAINRVAFNRAFVPGNPLNAPSTPWYVKEFPIPARDPAKARQLLEEAGFDVEVQPFEGATHTRRIFSGDFEVALSDWSGRADADANLHVILACGDSQSPGKDCNPKMDELSKAAGAAGTMAERRKLYREATAIFTEDLPTIPVYHPTRFFGASRQVQGVRLVPDGPFRPHGVRKGS